jgi:hypothetical protein
MLSIDHFGHVRDDRLRTIIEHWLDIRAGRLMPRRQAIDPGMIAAALPHVAIFQYLAGGRTFLCRLAGEEINKFNGHSLHGHRFNDFVPTSALPKYEAALSSVIEDRVVNHGIGRFLLDSRWIDGESLMLPLAENGEHPDAVLHGMILHARIHSGNRTAISGLDLIDTRTPLIPEPGSSEIVSRQHVIRVKTSETMPSLIL